MDLPRRIPGALIGLLAWSSLPLAAQSPGVSESRGLPFDTASLATGPRAEATSLLEKTIFQIDVLRLRLRFGPETASRIGSLVRGRNRTGPLADSVSRAAMESRNAWARLTFLRDVGFQRFLDGIEDNLEVARRGGVVDRAFTRTLSDSLPVWYGQLRERGVREGDEMMYRIRGDTLHAVFRTVEGRFVVNREDVGVQPGLAVLGGYFLPGSEFRDDLLDSLFRGTSSSSRLPPSGLRVPNAGGRQP